MDGLFENQVVAKISEDLIVWGFNSYKKVGVILDINDFPEFKNKNNENAPNKKERSKKIKIIADKTVFCLGLITGIEIGMIMMFLAIH